MIYSNYKARQREIEQALYEKKQPVYEKLLDLVFKLMKRAKQNQKIDEQEMTEFIMDFSKELLLWGSDDVIRSYVAWKRIAASNPQPEQMLLGRFCKL